MSYSSDLSIYTVLICYEDQNPAIPLEGEYHVPDPQDDLEIVPIPVPEEE